MWCVSSEGWLGMLGSLEGPAPLGCPLTSPVNLALKPLFLSLGYMAGSLRGPSIQRGRGGGGVLCVIRGEGASNAETAGWSQRGRGSQQSDGSVQGGVATL